ncbi:MAG TPA: P-II family nitrogen regulator [Candidatus Binataceae bacterium]|nr:P-II family nitrogen regulator [Candidatus Binataceae bacterium]
MKRVEMVTTSSALETFRDHASRLGIADYDVYEVRHSSRANLEERKRFQQGRAFCVDFLPRVKVEFVVFDEDAKAITQALLKTMNPDSVALYNIEEMVRPSESSHFAREDSRPRFEMSDSPDRFAFNTISAK